MRRAITWVYCEPKSKMRICSVIENFCSGRGRMSKFKCNAAPPEKTRRINAKARRRKVTQEFALKPPPQNHSDRRFWSVLADLNSTENSEEPTIILAS